MTGTQLKEGLHFTGDLCTAFPKCLQGWHIRVHTRSAEHKIRRKILQVVFPYLHFAAHFFKLQKLCIELLTGRSITAGYRTAVAQKLAHHRPVADT